MLFGSPKPIFSLTSTYALKIFSPKPTYSKPHVQRARKGRSATISCGEICHSWGAFKSCRKSLGRIRVLLTSVSHVDISPRNAPSVISSSSPKSQYLSFSVCQVRLGKWDEALEMLGEVNPFRGEANEPRELLYPMHYTLTPLVFIEMHVVAPFVIPDTHGGTKVTQSTKACYYHTLTLSHRLSRRCATCEGSSC